MTETTISRTWRFKWASLLQAVDNRIIIILLFGGISFSTATITLPWDLLGYMTHALNIINGHGYSYIDGQPVLFRGPVFSLLIALSFKLFGIAPESAFHVVRLFCIANPVLIYLFGKKLFNSNVGLVAAFLILTSYSMSFWSYRHLDAVWPFFVILHCYLLYEGFERKQISYFMVAGLCLGTAYLTKEVSLLFIPLGGMMFLWIKEYRTARNLKYIVACLLVFVSTVFPWAFYLWQHDSLHFLWGSGGPRVLGDMGVQLSAKMNLFANSVQVFKQYIAAFTSFYSANSKNTLTANFTLAPLFLLTWFFVGYKAFIGDKSSKILVLNIFLFLPIIYFIGKNHWRFGQVLHTMMISYLALSFLLFSGAKMIRRYLDRSNFFLQSIFLTFSLVFLFVQIVAVSYNDFGYIKFFKNTILYNIFYGNKGNPKVLGEISDPYLSEIIEQFNDVSGIDDSVLVNFNDIARIVFLKTGGNRRVDYIPYEQCTENTIDNIIKTKNMNDDSVIIMWSFFRPSDSRFSIYMVFEKQLKKMIQENDLKYIIISPQYPVYNKFFSNSPDYDLVFEAGPVGKRNKYYYLYRVKKSHAARAKSPVVTTPHFRQSLKKMKSEMPNRYRSFRKALASDFTGLSSSELEKILGD